MRGSGPYQTSNKYGISSYRVDLLIRYGLELLWSINKPLTDTVCELKYNDKVAYTEAKAHRSPEQDAVVDA